MATMIVFKNGGNAVLTFYKPDDVTKRINECKDKLVEFPLEPDIAAIDRDSVLVVALAVMTAKAPRPNPPRPPDLKLVS